MDIDDEGKRAADNRSKKESSDDAGAQQIQRMVICTTTTTEMGSMRESHIGAGGRCSRKIITEKSGEENI